MQLQNNWTWNMKKHNLWMGEILKQHTIIVHKQITDRPLTEICEKVFLSPCYFFYVAFFSLALLLCCTFLCCTIFTLECNLHSIHMALFPCFILSIMQFFPVALLSWCNFLNLNSSLLHLFDVPLFSGWKIFNSAWFSYCTVFTIHCFSVALFSCCTLFCVTLFRFHSFMFCDVPFHAEPFHAALFFIMFHFSQMYFFRVVFPKSTKKLSFILGID